MNWLSRKFDDLQAKELYAIMQLRSEVFVVEQNCVFLDADDKDYDCEHLMLWEEEKLIAYTRLVPPGISYRECSIGRVVTSPTARGRGIGKIIMQQSINRCRELFGNGPIKIGAQLYLKKFYESFHFFQSGNIYLEDGIEHIEMKLAENNS